AGAIEFIHRLVGIDLGHRATHGAGRTFGLPSCAQFDGGKSTWFLCERIIDLQARIRDAEVGRESHVAHHTHDFLPVRLALAATADAFAERLFIRPKMTGHRFVDHDDIVPVRCVRGSKDTALPELYSDRFKVIRTYGFGIDQRLLSRRRRGPAFDHNRMAAAKRQNRETRGNRRDLYSRQRSQAFFQSLEEGTLLIWPPV